MAHRSMLIPYARSEGKVHAEKRRGRGGERGEISTETPAPFSSLLSLLSLSSVPLSFSARLPDWRRIATSCVCVVWSEGPREGGVSGGERRRGEHGGEIVSWKKCKFFFSFLFLSSSSSSSSFFSLSLSGDGRRTPVLRSRKALEGFLGGSRSACDIWGERAGRGVWGGR